MIFQASGSRFIIISVILQQMGQRTGRYCGAVLLACAIANCQEIPKLKLTPQTVVWGYYSAAAPPVMRIQSGDTVEIETCSGNPDRLMAMGVPVDQIPAAL